MRVSVGNVEASIEEATDDERAFARAYLTFDDPQARFANTERYVELMAADDSFPAGLVGKLRAAGAKRSPPVVVLATQTAPRLPGGIDGHGERLAWLRDYQRAALASVLKHRRGIVKIPTGGGKTEVMAALAVVFPGATQLIVVPQADLLHQTAARIEQRTGEKVGILGDGIVDIRRVTVATFQTLHRRLTKDHDPEVRALLASVEVLEVDECFPAGTLVGKVAIENIRPGDTVPSYEEPTGQFVSRPVRQVFVSRPTEMVRLHFADGRRVACTGGHPFFTQSGWLPARALCGESVLSSPHEKRNAPVRDMRSAHRIDWAGGAGSCAIPDDLLLAPVSRGLAYAARAGDCFGERGPALSPDAACEPDADAFGEGADGGLSPRGGFVVPPGAWGQRGRSDGAREGAGGGAGVVVVGGGSDGGPDAGRVAVALQAGRGRSGAPGSDRGGRGIARGVGGASGGSAQGRVPSWARVARVEVLEPGSDGTFGGVCPDGLVYNLEVAGTHTYVAAGFVVHNCHTLPAGSLYAVARSCVSASVRVGFSGTPLARGDKKSLFVVAMLGSLIVDIQATTLIAKGVLSRPDVRMLRVTQGSTAPTWQGVYGECVVRSKKRNAVVVEAALRAAKPALVFVSQVGHGRALLPLMQKAGLRTALVWGAHDTASRKRNLEQLVRGDLDVIVCSAVFQQAIDVPTLRAVVNGAGGASVIATLQRLGRGTRIAEGKTTFEVWDVLDDGHRWLKRHGQERLAAYESEGHAVTVTDPGLSDRDVRRDEDGHIVGSGEQAKARTAVREAANADLLGVKRIPNPARGKPQAPPDGFDGGW